MPVWIVSTGGRISALEGCNPSWHRDNTPMETRGYVRTGRMELGIYLLKELPKQNAIALDRLGMLRVLVELGNFRAAGGDPGVIGTTRRQRPEHDRK